MPELPPVMMTTFSCNDFMWSFLFPFVISERQRGGARGRDCVTAPDVCHALYSETQALSLEGADMVAVIRAIERRTAAVV
jgi:hypothetical protein